MLCSRKIFCRTLIFCIVVFLQGPAQSKSLDLPLSFDVKPQSLSNNEQLFLQRKYRVLAKKKWISFKTPQEQYLYIRSLYHLKDWKSLVKVSQNFDATSYLYPYIAFYHIKALIALKEYYLAYDFFTKKQSLLKNIPYEEEVLDTYENILAGLLLKEKSKNLGSYYYYSYFLRKNKEDLKKSVALLNKKALSLLTLKNYSSYVLKENLSKTAHALKLLNPSNPLIPRIYLANQEKLKAGEFYFNQKKYTLALPLLKVDSLEASLCRIALNKGSSSDYEKAHANLNLSLPILMNAYLKKKAYSAMAEVLQKFYKPGWVREIIVGLASQKKYSTLKSLLIGLSGVSLTDRELSMIFYYLGYAFSLENRKNALSFFKEAAVRYSADYYGRECFKKLSLNQKDFVLKEEKKLFNLVLKVLKKDLAALNKNQFSKKEGKALFFLKIGEYQKGYKELRKNLGDLKPYGLALLKFYKSINRTFLMVHFAHEIYQDISVKTRTRLFYPQLFTHLYPVKYQDYIKKAQKIHNSPALLTTALIRQESRFHEEARSWVGAQGLMQLMPKTAAPILKSLKRKKLITHSNIYHPYVNILAGTSYVQWLLERVYKNYQSPFKEILSIASYNAGPRRIKAHFENFQEKEHIPLLIESIPLAETREYTKLILLYQEFYLKLYPYLNGEKFFKPLF